MTKNKRKENKNGVIVQYNKDRQKILNGQSWTYTSSIDLAKSLEVDHKEVMRKIRKILNEYNLEMGDKTPPISEIEEYIYINSDFTYSIKSYKDNANRMKPYYKLSKDLVTLVIFSFKTERAKVFHKLYISRFNAMQKELDWYKMRYLGMVTRTSLTDTIKDYYKIEAKENPYMVFTDLVYELIYLYRAYQIRIIGDFKGNVRPWLPDKN